MRESADKSQLDKFKQAARDLECDDDEQRFKERLGALIDADNLPVTLLVEGSPPRVLNTQRFAELPAVGDEMMIRTPAGETKVRVTRTQSTVDNPESLFANYRHWACVERI